MGGGISCPTRRELADTDTLAATVRTRNWEGSQVQASILVRGCDDLLRVCDAFRHLDRLPGLETSCDDSSDRRRVGACVSSCDLRSGPANPSHSASGAASASFAAILSPAGQRTCDFRPTEGASRTAPGGCSGCKGRERQRRQAGLRAAEAVLWREAVFHRNRTVGSTPAARPTGGPASGGPAAGDPGG